MRFWNRSDFIGGPPGISDGLVTDCEVCGELPAFDYQVDDETWQRVVPKAIQPSVVCLPCLDKMATEQGIDVCQHLREVQFTGCKSTVVLLPGFVVSW